MAETVATVIKDALQQIVVQASEAPIEADEAQTAIRFLNRLMARFDAEGIDLGYTKVISLGDLVTIPDGAYDGVIYNLSLALAPQYDVPVSIDLKMLAKEGLKTLRTLTFSIGPSSYGDTLPIGSGNEDDSYGNYSHFYPDDQDSILAETTGCIGLESDTVNNNE